MTQPRGATSDMVKALHRPTPHDRVQWRADRTTRDNARISVLAYIDSRYVMDTLDECVLPENWQDKYEDAIGGYRCSIGILVEGEWVWKSDAAPASDIEGVKGGHSDSMKRAGVKWGIGRDLYDYPDLWVDAVETYNGSGKYKPAHLPVWNGSQWTTDNRTPSQSTGRTPSRPAAPTPIKRTSTDMPEFPDDWEDAPARANGNDNTECPIHHVTWKGEWTDLWHKTEDGAYCRHPDNIPKGRPASAGRR